MILALIIITIGTIKGEQTLAAITIMEHQVAKVTMAQLKVLKPTATARHIMELLPRRPLTITESHESITITGAGDLVQEEVHMAHD